MNVSTQKLCKTQFFIGIIKIIDKLQQMSRQRSLKSKNYSVQLRQDCDQLFSNLKRQNSINSYLKKTARRDSHHHFRELKNVTDSYMFDSGLNSMQKQNQQNEVLSVKFKDKIQKKIEEMIENKLSKFLDAYIQKYVNRILEEHKSGIEVYYRAYLQQIQIKLTKADEGYKEMIHNYDSFLRIVDTIKQKHKRTEKFITRLDFQQQMTKVLRQIEVVKDKVSVVQKDQSQLRKSNLHTLETSNHKIQPILLSEKWEMDVSRQELRVVVDTFNENFIRIDEKLKEITSYMS